MIKESSSLDCMHYMSSYGFIHWFTRDHLFIDVNVLFPSSETVTCMCTNMHPNQFLVCYCLIHTCPI